MLKGCSEIGRDNKSVSLGGFPWELGPNRCLRGFFFSLKNYIMKVIYVSYKKQPHNKTKLPSLQTHFQGNLS